MVCEVFFPLASNQNFVALHEFEHNGERIEYEAKTAFRTE